MDWHNQHSSTSRAPPAAFIRPALPTPSKRVPVGSHWIHEIKHDGYRVMVRRDGARIRLFTRNGAD
jgi:ATP-dependent DNA ligase